MNQRFDVEQEIAWRLQQYQELQELPTWPEVPYQEVTQRGLHTGQRGIYRDATRTGAIVTDGIAVGLLHTGKHYDDELTDAGIVYHYPRTKTETTDSREIQSLRNAALYNVPVFVIAGRHVHLGWIENQDSAIGAVFVTFQKPVSPATVDVAWVDPSQPLEIITRRRRTTAEIERAERDPKFRYLALRRYGTRCAVTDIDVPTLLEAAHVVPVAKGGPDDPRNSLLLTPTAHRAFDKHLWGIEPKTLKIVPSKTIDQLPRLRFAFQDLKHLKYQPDSQAIEWRWEAFQKSEK